ncbi:hypothetical protein EJB05_03919, partial [Eragrostis curvula]
MATTTHRSSNAIAVAMVMVAAATAALGAGGAEAAGSTGTVSCGDVVSALVPCSAFLTGAGPATPPAACCDGARSLLRMAGTADARRAMCRCMVQAAPSFGVLLDRAQELPDRCNIDFKLPIGGVNTDCNK